MLIKGDTMTDRDRKIITFIAGSSFPCLLLPFLTLGTAMLLRPDQDIPPHTLLWALPVIMGLWNLGLSKLSNMSRKAHIIAGIIIGLCFTTLGVSTGAPGQLYNLHGKMAFIMIPIGTASHTFIWGVIVYWVNGKLGLLDRKVSE